MAATTYIAMFVFLVLLLAMALTAGTKNSISALAERWRWLLLVALWSQCLLLPQMFDITKDGWQWLPFIGIGAVVFCGGATIFTHKLDWWTHIISAAVAFTALIGWVMVMDSRCLLPLVVCACAGRERIIWRCEIGLVASVYMVLLL